MQATFFGGAPAFDEIVADIREPRGPRQFSTAAVRSSSGNSGRPTIRTVPSLLLVFASCVQTPIGLQMQQLAPGEVVLYRVFWGANSFSPNELAGFLLTPSRRGSSSHISHTPNQFRVPRFSPVGNAPPWGAASTIGVEFKNSLAESPVSPVNAGRLLTGGLRALPKFVHFGNLPSID